MKKSNFKFVILLQVIILLNISLLSSGLKSQWSETSNGMGTYNVVKSFFANVTNVFAGTISGIYLTTNNGLSWIPKNNGLPLPLRPIYSIASNVAYMFIGVGSTSEGIYRSSNNGNNWEFCCLYGQPFPILSIKDANIYVGTGSGAWVSTNNGTIWNELMGLHNLSIGSFSSIGNNLFACTGFGFSNGVLLSTNNGSNWVWVNNGLPNYRVFALTTIGSYLFAALEGGSGVYYTTNNGSNWIATNSSLTSGIVMSLTTDGTNLIAGTYQGGVFFSSNNGERWIKKNQGFNSVPTYVNSLLFSNNYIFSGIDSNNVWRRNFIDPLPLAPTLISPANNSIGKPLNLNFVWRMSEYSIQYNLVLATDVNFSNIVLNDTTIIDTLKITSNLTPFTNYYWKVKAKSNAGWGALS